MRGTAIAILIRQIIVRTVLLAPFFLAFLFIAPPLNIIAVCLLILKLKLPSDTDLYELQVLSKYCVLILTRSGDETDQQNLVLMKEAFGFDNEVIHQADVDGSAPKFLVDAAFGLIEGLAVAAMVVWYLAQVL